MDSSIHTQEESTLAQLLAEIQLPQWHDLIIDWTSRFDGWRAAYDVSPTMQPDFGPLALVIKALLNIDPSAHGSDTSIAELLSNMDFTCWRACRADNPRDIWYPLQETFRDFSARGPVNVWSDTVSSIPGPVIKYWLLGRHAYKDWAPAHNSFLQPGSPSIQ